MYGLSAIRTEQHSLVLFSAAQNEPHSKVLFAATLQTDYRICRTSEKHTDHPGCRGLERDEDGLREVQGHDAARGQRAGARAAQELRALEPAVLAAEDLGEARRTGFWPLEST